MLASFCPSCMDQVERDAGKCPRCSFPRPSSGWPVDPFIGRVIKDKYRLESRLGAGGFGLVFLAYQVQGDIDLGEVVLKFLHADMARNQSVRRRFINEARASRKIRSPNAVKVFDLDFDEDGIPFMVMEYLEGESLQDIMLRKGRLSPHRVFRIGLQVANALDECHNAGIIHRDLKPDNLLLLADRSDEFVKVLDFGIARVPSLRGTLTHTFMGTPRYMPPEQILQNEIDGGVDIYSLGVILYECLAGSPPIEAKTPMEYLQKNLNIEPTPLRDKCPDMPESLEKLLDRMIAKERSKRPQTMAHIEKRLRSIGVANGWVPEDTGRHRTGSFDEISDEISEEEDLKLRPSVVQLEPEGFPPTMQALLPAEADCQEPADDSLPYMEPLSPHIAVSVEPVEIVYIDPEAPVDDDEAKTEVQEPSEKLIQSYAASDYEESPLSLHETVQTRTPRKTASEVLSSFMPLQKQTNMFIFAAIGLGGLLVGIAIVFFMGEFMGGDESDTIGDEVNKHRVSASNLLTINNEKMSANLNQTINETESIYINLDVRPPNANIVLDGVSRKDNPLKLTLSSRKCTLRVSADGYVSKTKTFVADRSQKLSIALNKKR